MTGSPPRDIVIVGGDVIGVCTAYHLLRHHARLVAAATASFSPAPTGICVTLVEAHQIAGAASGKAGGFLALDWHGPATTSLAELSYLLHQELAREYDGGRSWGYRSVDSLSYTVSAASSGSPGSELTLEAAQNNAVPSSPERDDLDEADIDYHWLNAAGQGSVLGTADTTAQILPREFVESMFALAKLRGLEYVHGTAVKFNRTVGQPKSLCVRDSSSQAILDLPCTDLVLAAGPWTGSLIDALGLTSVLPVDGSPGHSLIIRPNSPDVLPPLAVFANIYGANRPLRSESGAILTTTRPRTTESPEILPRANGTVYVSGENEAAPLPASSSEVDSLRDESISQRLIRAMGYVSPALETGLVEARQLCYRAVLPDARPAIGELEDNVWVATGHGSWGISLAPGTGHVMAELILTGKCTSASISALDPKRFRAK